MAKNNRSKPVSEGGNLRPFKKGQSGNPKGKKPGTRSRKTIVKQWIEVEQKIRNPLTGVEEVLTQEDIMVLAQINLARKGHLGAYRELMDTMYGKLTENIQVAPVEKIPTREIYVVRKK